MDDHVQVRINGHSMWPTYIDQQVVTFVLIKGSEAIPTGAVVLAQHPLKPEVKAGNETVVPLGVVSDPLAYNMV